MSGKPTAFNKCDQPTIKTEMWGVKGTFLTGLKLLNESVSNTCIAVFNAIGVSCTSLTKTSAFVSFLGEFGVVFLFDSRDKAVAEGPDVF